MTNPLNPGNIMKRAIYPGTFDPFTNGHLDIVQRASVIFDEIIVTVATNNEKRPLFTEKERINMIRQSVSPLKNIIVDSFKGLLVHYAQSRNAIAVIRGLRAVSDFEYEFQMALMNRKLAEEITTVFLMPDEKYTYLSSTIVREIALLGGDISSFVPEIIRDKLIKKYYKNRGKK
jgi:pantetheine-phosphate adenylyltransferase